MHKDICWIDNDQIEWDTKHPDVKLNLELFMNELKLGLWIENLLHRIIQQTPVC